MIVRTWRGRARASKSDAYVDHFRRNVLPELREIEGFLGASLLKAERGDVVELLVLTRWASMDSIRAFAGKDVDRAVVEPEAIRVLLDFDPTVRHYDVVEEALAGR